MIYLGLYILFAALCFVILLMVEHTLILKKYKTENKDLSYEEWVKKGNAFIDYKVIAFLSLFWIVNLSILALLAVDKAVSTIKAVCRRSVKWITGTK